MNIKNLFSFLEFWFKYSYPPTSHLSLSPIDLSLPHCGSYRLGQGDVPDPFYSHSGTVKPLKHHWQWSIYFLQWLQLITTGLRTWDQEKSYSSSALGFLSQACPHFLTHKSFWRQCFDVFSKIFHKSHVFLFSAIFLLLALHSDSICCFLLL